MRRGIFNNMPLLFWKGDKILKKTILISLLFITSIFIFFDLNTDRIDAAQTSTPMVNYSVSPEMADNQINKSLGYYDLKVSPNQKEDIKFKINNVDSSSHTYTVSINRANTDSNGVIDYDDHGTPMESHLKYDLEKMATYPKKVTVPAKSSKEVTVSLQFPNGKFSGELLGGILVDEDNQVSSKTAKGLSLKNKYQYVLGIQIQQNTDSVNPNLKFIKASEKSNNGQIFVDADIDNDVPTLEKNVSIDARVTRKNSSKTVITADKENMSIAPDTYFDYPVNVNSLTGANRNRRLKPGTYTMYLDVKANGGKNLWNLQRNFTISKGQNKKLNKAVPNNSKSTLYVIGAIVLLLIIGSVVIFTYRKNRK